MRHIHSEAASGKPGLGRQSKAADMNRHVNAIAGRLSLRPPQRHSLEILDWITEIVPPKKGPNIPGGLAARRSESQTIMDCERVFPSLCLALATGAD